MYCGCYRLLAYLQEFESVNDAGRFLDHKNGSRVSKAARLGQRCENYQFSYEHLPFMKEFKTKRNVSKKAIESAKLVNSKRVGKFDKISGELLEEYESLQACKRAGYTNCQGVIEGTRTHCKGFIFKYL